MCDLVCVDLTLGRWFISCNEQLPPLTAGLGAPEGGLEPLPPPLPLPLPLPLPPPLSLPAAGLERWPSLCADIAASAAAACTQEVTDAALSLVDKS